MTALRQAAVRDVFLTGLGEAGGVTVGADGAGCPVVDVAPARWLEAGELARDVLGLTFLDWLSAVDEPDAAAVDVVLHVADPERITRRLILRTRVPAPADGEPPTLASLTALWPGVAWHERETFEMFGVLFTGFDDGQREVAGPGAGEPLGLRPLLLPEGFEGTPLRKSFVLAARVSKAWPGAKEPGEGAGGAPSRRATRPPGVPDPAVWGPREPAAVREAGQEPEVEEPGR